MATNCWLRIGPDCACKNRKIWMQSIPHHIINHVDKEIFMKYTSINNQATFVVTSAYIFLFWSARHDN